MRLPNIFSILLLTSALAWVACGGGQSTEGNENSSAETQAEEQSLATIAASGRSLQWTDLPVGAPESIIRSGDTYYVSNVGAELKPSEQDGDGYIMKLDGEGNVETEKFIEGLDAPKGSAIIDGTFYVADINKVNAFDLATGESKGEIDFSSTGTMFLNDLVPMEGGLVASATDINRIYQINLADNSFEEIITQPTLQGPNGLWYNAADDLLFVTTYPGEPTGKLYTIDLGSAKDDTYTAAPVGSYTGMLDGLAVIGDYAFVSDWNRQTVVIINTATGQVSGSGLPAQVQGPADFYFDMERGEFWLPGMMENSITVQTLPATN